MENTQQPAGQGPNKGRKFIGVRFDCCGVYTRIYFNAEKNGYFGYCPLCHKKVNVRVDPEKGVDNRFFSAK